MESGNRNNKCNIQQRLQNHLELGDVAVSQTSGGKLEAVLLVTSLFAGCERTSRAVQPADALEVLCNLVGSRLSCNHRQAR